MSKIIVTGASGGFGKLTVEALLKRGHKVAAAMRDTQGKNRAAAAECAALGAAVTELDVTRDASVEQGAAQAIKELGGLDAVVNYAGLGVLGVQETFTSEDWKRLFDVNVFGMQRVNRAVLPHLRSQGAGLLVQVSSLLGRIAMPFYGPYNASKWAVEAMSENYRVELSGTGVDVVIVEPGGYPTTFVVNLMRPSDRARAASLGELGKMPEGMLRGFEQAMAANPAQNPQNVADAVVKLIETPAGQRPFRTIVDKMGMGEAIGPYNDQLEKISDGLYTAFGIGQMRKLKIPVK